jgi:hypothetical protein
VRPYRVPFLPSTHGLRFANRFPPQRTVFLRSGGRTILAVGNAANGLCGGMSLVTRERFEAGLPPWEETEPPEGGSDHFQQLVARQIDTFELGRVPLRFYDLMVARPNRPTRWSRILRRRSRLAESVNREWPRIRRDIDRGELPMVGLLRAASWDPRQLGRNHQVLAYGYELDPESLTINIYDPNYPRDDTVEIRLRLSLHHLAADLTYSTGEPLLAFFRA